MNIAKSPFDKLKAGKKISAKAFTLVELLVVMAIIAILVTLIIYAINAARMQARNTQRRNNANNIKTGNEGYYSTYKQYFGADDAAYTGKDLLTNATFNTYVPGLNTTTAGDPAGEEERVCYVRKTTGTYYLWVIPEPLGSVSCGSALPTGTYEDFSVKK